MVRATSRSAIPMGAARRSQQASRSSAWRRRRCRCVLRGSCVIGWGREPRLTAPDGALDGTFRVTVEAGSGARTVTQLELWRLVGSSRWDTIPSTFQWVVAAAGGLDSPLHNAANGSVSFATGEGQSFYLFAPDPSPSAFTAGSQSASSPVSPTAPAQPPTRPSSHHPRSAHDQPGTGRPGQTLSVTVTGRTSRPAPASASAPTRASPRQPSAPRPASPPRS